MKTTLAMNKVDWSFEASIKRFFKQKHPSHYFFGDQTLAKVTIHQNMMLKITNN